MCLVLDYIRLDNEMSNSAEGFPFVSISEESVFFMATNPRNCVGTINSYLGEKYQSTSGR